jgi:hypothetical protein
MDHEAQDEVPVVRLPDTEPSDDQLAGDLPDELLFQLLMC